ncbi:MAG: hypothetical protein NNA23_04710 [Nitrospira sp.]|nr:hypothetical protein [Nitrospira sp.]MCP9463734.1 hypothetical protein [Nitrospira sp.]
MPVNLNPEQKRRRVSEHQVCSSDRPSQLVRQTDEVAHQFGDDTEEDRNRALAEAEWKNLWEETEVIDMDTF